MRNDVKKTISVLISRIRDANSAYRAGNPFISDTDYDNMVDELKSMVDADTFSSVRNSLMEEPGKVHHPYIMGSLDKIKAFDNSAPVSEWIVKNVINTGNPSDGIFVSSKIDGCSARLSYRNGILVGASTRGNAEYGEDILAKAVLFAPTILNGGFSGDIRGEITLTHETFAALEEFTGKEFKNLRNSTVGLINSKFSSDEEISFLRFFAYEIMGKTGLSKKEQFEKLHKLGFETALHVELTDIFNSQIVGNGEEFDRALLSIYNDFSEKSPYDIDGLVVTDIKNENAFENERIPQHTVAVKFNQMTATTKLLDVVWNVSKSGRLSPVGIVDMVVLGGSEITNVTLNNLRYMKEIGITLGCEVDILKSGDIIPKVVGVSHPHPQSEIPIKYPKICPSCRHELTYEQDGLFPICTNVECNAVAHSKILHFLRQLGIKNVSLKTISKFGLKSIDDLLELKPDGGAVKSKFFNDLNKLMFGAPKEDLLSAFDYDGVSSKIILKMLLHYGYDRLVNSSLSELSEYGFPHGVGEKFMRKFCDGFNKSKTTYEKILTDARYHGQNGQNSISSGNAVNGTLSGKGFVVTGALNTMSRDGFRNLVVENGGTYQTSVSKKTDFLVCNDMQSATSKVKKATELGVSVIDENKFISMIKDGADGFAIF